MRYTRGLVWRMHCGAEVTESDTNKQHHHLKSRVSKAAMQAGRARLPWTVDAPKARKGARWG